MRSPGIVRLLPIQRRIIAGAIHGIRTGRKFIQPTPSIDRSVQRPARTACGRRVSCGRTNLQSSPSNRAANIAGDMRITPSAIVSQTNLQPSRRLCTNTRPVRSQTKILIRSARFDRNTKAAPLNGSRRSISCTFAASPSWPQRKSIGRVAMQIFRSAPARSS